MNQTMIDYLLFIGMGLYATTAVIFAYLFYRTTRTVDGIGLLFLRLLTFGIFLGSTTITAVRFCNMYVDGFDTDVGRVVAIVNPIVLLGVGLYLNFLFHQKYDKTANKGMKKDVK